MKRPLSFFVWFVAGRSLLLLASRKIFLFAAKYIAPGKNAPFHPGIALATGHVPANAGVVIWASPATTHVSLHMILAPNYTHWRAGVAAELAQGWKATDTSDTLSACLKSRTCR